jgi:anti-anti-sigma factor
LERREKSPSGHPERFGIDVEPDREIARVVPRGELDLATTSTLDRQLAEMHEVGFRDLVLDLRRLTFIDTQGVHLVQRWSAAAESDGFSFSVIAGTESVHRVFELTGTVDDLPFVEQPSGGLLKEMPRRTARSTENSDER